MNGKTKAAPRRKYSKGWAILSESCMRTTRREMSEGLVGNEYGKKVVCSQRRIEKDDFRWR